MWVGWHGLSKDGKKQSQLSNEEKELYKNALLKLERRGYGMIKKKRLPDEALSDTFINDYLKNSKSFIGCFPKDKLKNIKINKKKNMSCIVNLDDSTGPGSQPTGATPPRPYPWRQARDRLRARGPRSPSTASL